MNETDEQMSQEGDDDGQLLIHFTNTIITIYWLMRYCYTVMDMFMSTLGTSFLMDWIDYTQYFDELHFLEKIQQKVVF